MGIEPLDSLGEGLGLGLGLGLIGYVLELCVKELGGKVRFTFYFFTIQNSIHSLVLLLVSCSSTCSAVST